jgi:hypothetical protein
MLVIVIAAFVLGAYLQVRNWQRREEFIAQLYSTTDAELNLLLEHQEWIALLPLAIQRCELAEEQMRELAEDARRQNDKPGVLRAIEYTRARFRRKGQELRARLSRLQR